MNLTLIPTILFAFCLQTIQVKFEQLLGTWQLVHFDAMDHLKSSPQYLNANAAMREGIDYKIQNRLESTVYQFVESDSLKFTDLENGEIILKNATVLINERDVLVISFGDELRKAKIVSVDAHQLILEPISEHSNGDRLTFEKVVNK